MHGFYQFLLPLKTNLFDELVTSVAFETVGKGRLGNHLVKLSDLGIPLVRTTTKYTIPPHDFSAIHNIILESIQDTVQTTDEILIDEVSFNNALIEVYDASYKKMKYHSDQCLDIDTSSYIALFSCYEHPNDVSEHVLRKLKVRDKITNKEFEFVLENNSVILFSVATNAKFQHKIVLEQVSGKKPVASENRWLGITFRTSKTFIQFKDDKPYFLNGELLQLADETQQRSFYITRGEENKSMDFKYPEINYTLSEADLMFPKI